MRGYAGLAQLVEHVMDLVLTKTVTAILSLLMVHDVAGSSPVSRADNTKGRLIRKSDGA